MVSDAEIAKRLYGTIKKEVQKAAAQQKLPSRDAISIEMYGMKFSSLPLDRKQNVNAAITQISREARRGSDVDIVLRKIALDESYKIIKQLKEIGANPRDSIDLPPGVIDDAAKLLHYHYQAVGNKKPLSAGDITEIRREVKKQFGEVDPDVVNCIATYLSNPKGRFTGVDLKNLRGKLRSFLEPDQIAKIKDNEILSARDITIAHLYDKWMKGNLTAGIRPRIEELARETAEEITRSGKGGIIRKDIDLKEVQDLVESAGLISNIQNGTSHGLERKIIRQSMYNLGIHPSQIVGFEAKERVANLRNATYAHINEYPDYRGTPGPSNFRRHWGLGKSTRRRGGGVFRRNWSIHGMRTQQQRDSLPKKNVHFGIGKSTRVTLTPYESSHRIATPNELPLRIPEGENSGYSGGRSDQNWSDTTAVFDPNYEEIYGNVPREAYTTRRYKYSPGGKYLAFSDEEGFALEERDALIPRRIVGGVPLAENTNWVERAEELWTRTLHQPIAAVTAHEANSPLMARVNRMDEEDQYAFKEAYFDLEEKYGAYYASQLLERGIPEEKFIAAMEFGRDGVNNLLDEYAIQSRFETKIKDDPDTFSPYDMNVAMLGKYDQLTRRSPVIVEAEKFLGLFDRDTSPAWLKGMYDDTIADIAFKRGESGVEGVKRVGILGSDSFDDKRFINAWLKENWNPDDLMISTTHVGKDLQGGNTGASKFANDWAHFHGVPVYKHAARNYPGGKGDKTAHVEDVFSTSDEVVAFFEQLYPDASAIKRIKQIGSYAKKFGIPVRVIFNPTHQAMSSDITDKEGFAFKDRMMQEWTDVPNIKVEFYKPNAYPEYGTSARGIGPSRPWKYLAKGGSLKPNQPAIVGEAGPEALIPDGCGGFNVIPNNRLRFLEKGTFSTPDHVINVTGKANSEGEHFFKTDSGAILPSVSTIVRYGTKQMQDDMAFLDNIPGWVSAVGTEIHRQVALEFTKRLGGSTTALETPVDFTKVDRRKKTPGELKAMADNAAPNVIAALDKLGFEVTAVEQRFVDLNRGFSGTLDLIGSLNGTPTLIDLKSTSETTASEKESHRLQLGAYASFFDKSSRPDLMHILPVNRNSGDVLAPPKIYGERDIANAIADFDQHRFGFESRLHSGELNSVPGLSKLIGADSAIGKLPKAMNDALHSINENLAIFGEQKYIGEYLNTIAEGLKSGSISITSEVKAIIENYRKYESEFDKLGSFASGKVMKQLSENNANYLKSLTLPKTTNSGKSPGIPNNAGADAFTRLAEMQSHMVDFFDVSKGEMYPRPIATTVPGHNVALAKTLPGFEAVGATPDETWDKNPSRLRIFGARLNNISAHLGDGGVHPMIKQAMAELESAGWGADALNMLAAHPMGGIVDDEGATDLFNKIYQTLKPISFDQSLLASGRNEDTMLWEDSRTLLNILEEAAKSFEGTPRLPHMTYSPPKSSSRKKQPSPLPANVPGLGMPGSPIIPTSPQIATSAPYSGLPFFPVAPGSAAASLWGIPSSSGTSGTTGAPVASQMKYPTSSARKCKGVDLCQPTMSKLESWIKGISGESGSGGGSSGKGGKGPQKTPIDQMPAVDKWQRFLEKLPIVGAPMQAKRQWGEASQTAADYLNSPNANVEDYTKLLQKEDIARRKYYRSIRGATTSFLIAQHVMRIFGQTSQVFNKSSESIGKGLGYILDMFLMPVLPYLTPVVRGLVGVGNIFRSMNHFIAPILILGGGIFLKLGYDIYNWLKALGRIPAVFYKIEQTIDDFESAVKFDLNRVSNRVNPELDNDYVIDKDTGAFRPARKYELDLTQKHYKQTGKTSSGPNAGDWYEEHDEYEYDDIKNSYEKRKYNKGIDKVPGTGNSDSVLAMLTPGEMVLPVPIASKIRGYADGGIVGGVTSLMEGITNAYSGIISSDAGSAALTTMGMFSKMAGALMAPLAPVMAGAAIAGKGWSAVKNAIDRGTNVTSSVSQGGFGAIRTMLAVQLAATMGGLLPLIPIAAAVAGIYAWTQGFGPMAEATMKGIKGVLDAMKDWLKDRFKLESKPVEVKPDEKVKDDSKLKDDKLKQAEEERRRRAKSELDKTAEEEKRKAEEEKNKNKDKSWKDKVEEFLKGGKLEMLKGVPQMGAFGLVTGAMESNDPVEIAKAGALGAAGQLGFNAIEKSFGPTVAKALGGFVAPEFAGSVAHAIVNGEGFLSPSNYIPGLKGNDAVESALRVGGSTALSAGMGWKGMATAALSDAVGGTGGLWSLLTGQGINGIIGESIESSQVGNRKIGGEYGLAGETYKGIYNLMQGENIKALDTGAAPNQGDVLARILTTLEGLTGMMKQPTINQNTFEVKNDNDWDLMQKIQQALTQMSYSSGAQRTG